MPLNQTFPPTMNICLLLQTILQGGQKTTLKRRGIVVETYSESTIRRTEHVFVNVTFILMLFCPIIALSFIEEATAKLAIVLVFLLLGAVLTSGILTSANNAGLAVLAGYVAISSLILHLGTGLILPQVWRNTSVLSWVESGPVFLGSAALCFFTCHMVYIHMYLNSFWGT